MRQVIHDSRGMVKSLEFRTPAFIFFDLKKCYDSVPRNGLFTVLSKLGFGPVTLSLLRSFHDDMKAVVRTTRALRCPWP